MPTIRYPNDPAAAGIDYGLGQTNVDRETGIRYGCISSHSVSQAWADDSEADYGDPTCPECGSTLYRPDDPKAPKIGRGQRTDLYSDRREYGSGSRCHDFACHHCRRWYESGDCYGDEPIGYYLNTADYRAQSCLDSDILITRSPFYCFAPFCSPCVPGAGNLDSADGRTAETGVKTYCLGHDWFTDDNGDPCAAPYDVYDVKTGEIVSFEE
jgi:hypothetical protein